MASGYKGNQALVPLKKALAALPRTVAYDVAHDAATLLTRLSRAAHSTKRNVYGDAYPVGVDGDQLTIRRTGKALDGMRFEAIGTIVRCVLTQPYAKYLIGKYRVLPNGVLPAYWARALNELVPGAVARAAKRAA